MAHPNPAFGNAESRGRARRSWEKFLNPESLRFSLSVGAVYLTAYEMLLDSLIEKLRDFYSISWSSEGTETGDDYRKKVLARDRMPYMASAKWFVEMGALAEEDLETLVRIRDHRNFVAHSIPRIVMEDGAEVDAELLGSIVELVGKVDRWWLRYVEVPSNPDFDGRTFTEEEYSQSMSMKMVNLSIMVNFVAGNDEDLRQMHATFTEVWPLEETQPER